jgi:hypothetical protein
MEEELSGKERKGKRGITEGKKKVYDRPYDEGKIGKMLKKRGNQMSGEEYEVIAEAKERKGTERIREGGNTISLEDGA